ncbi:MAG: ROK family protein [Gammaproteobacteria bacterium]|nr:ROK family protein [Gammaproteobacteria bacterium]
MTSPLRIGVDLGGTKIEAVAFDDNGAILARRRLPTPSGDYHDTLRTIVDLVTGIEAELGTQGSVGIGTPGAVSRASGLVKNSNSTCLNGKPLQQNLEQALARPVRIANDADCFALSEATDGAAAGADVAFGVIIGTGVGGGIVAHGRLLAGPNAIAGEWGHNPLPWPQQHEWPGPSCYCGKAGCIETLLSGPGMTRDHFALTGDSLTPDAIAVRAAAGDEVCEATLARYEDRLARALAGVINILDPDVIVLGGGVSNLSRLYGNIPRLWGKYVFSDRVDTRLNPAQHGDSSGVRGAAWLWGR